MDFIDCEYASYSYNAFDIANHFSEFMGYAIAGHRCRCVHLLGCILFFFLFFRLCAVLRCSALMLGSRRLRGKNLTRILLWLLMLLRGVTIVFNRDLACVPFPLKSDLRSTPTITRRRLPSSRSAAPTSGAPPTGPIPTSRPWLPCKSRSRPFPRYVALFDVIRSPEV